MGRSANKKASEAQAKPTLDWDSDLTDLPEEDSPHREVQSAGECARGSTPGFGKAAC